MELTAYLTGITGTVAPFLATTLRRYGYRIVGKHYRIEKDEDISTSIDDLTSNKPTIVVHLALGPIAWAKALALWAHQHQKTFVYISTASVYDDQGNGPYTIHAPVVAKQGYGLYKFQCEQAVKEVNANAYIVRIGWQIDPLRSATSNNMFRFFFEQIHRQGKIGVSSEFFPSASFLPDTTEAMYRMIQSYSPGLYFINGNRHLSLYDIAVRLNEKYQQSWVVERLDNFKRNDILIDPRLHVPFL
jgi:dTDP-4-dehydrorhamnose reductase